MSYACRAVIALQTARANLVEEGEACSGQAPLAEYSTVTVAFFCLLGRYYKLSVLLMCFFIPTFVPWYVWGESLWVAYFIPALLRYTVSLNAAWLVNSAAHMWGNRPYDNTINPRENKYVAFGAIGTFISNSLSLLRSVKDVYTTAYQNRSE